MIILILSSNQYLCFRDGSIQYLFMIHLALAVARKTFHQDSLAEEKLINYRKS